MSTVTPQGQNETMASGAAGSTAGYGTKRTVDWSDLGREMWSFLTGRKAQIDYQFVDMTVEVPRDTGANAPRATWRIDGTLRIATHDVDSAA